MNLNHQKLCPSPEWAAHIQDEILPALTSDVSLGADMLEIGPGPGAATEWLRHRVRRLTALELDPDAAQLLATRFAGTNVEVRTGDATVLVDGAESFDSVGSFTMLHHVPTAALQNKILAQAFRVLRPGGVLICSDSLASNDLHHFHAGDTYNPVEPSSILGRLQAVGFDKITIAVDGVLRFAAHKPTATDTCQADPSDQASPRSRPR
jgi:SAM-dependent methyltransferase